MNDNKPKQAERVGHRSASRAIFFTLAAAVLLITVALTVLIMLLFFPVAEIEIAGNSRYTYSELIESSGIKRGDRLYYVDRERAEKRLLDSFPYLKNARVHTYFPNRVKIEIEEYGEIYLVRHEAGFAYLSPELEILEITDEPPEYESLFVTYIKTAAAFSGAQGEKCSREDTDMALLLISHIKKMGISERISMIDAEDRYALSFVIDKKCRFVIGTMADADEKLEAAKLVCFDDSFNSDKCSVIDATDKKRVFVRYIDENDMRKEFDF